MSISNLAPTSTLALGLIRSAEMKAALALDLQKDQAGSANAAFVLNQARAEQRVAQILLKMEKKFGVGIDFYT